MIPIELLSLLLECSTEAASDPTFINPVCPALAPPPGELPLHPNAASLWSPSVGVLAACCALVCLSLALRLFTRTFIVKRRLALEDALMVFAAVLFIPIVGLQLNAYDYGGSKHQWNVTVGDISIALHVGPLPGHDLLPGDRFADCVHYVYAVLILCCLSLYAAKLSILLQIKHIFEGTQQPKKFVDWNSWAMIALVTCTYIFTTMLLIFSCTPVRKVWNPLPPGKCHNSAAGYVSGTVNLGSDVAVLLLPIAGVSRLRMEMRKKAAVSAVFSTGLVACAVSVVRLYYSYREARSNNKSYWLALEGLCGATGIAMVILCDCFMSFPGFLKWARGDRKRSQQYQWYRSRGYTSENRSGLRSDATVELGKIEVTIETEITNELLAEDRRVLW